MEFYLSAAAADMAERLPSPEDVFFAWMLNLPAGADLPRAARAEIARIDGAGRDCSRLLHLRGLFQQATVGSLQPAVRRQRRIRH